MIPGLFFSSTSLTMHNTRVGYILKFGESISECLPLCHFRPRRRLEFSPNQTQIYLKYLNISVANGNSKTHRALTQAAKGSVLLPRHRTVIAHPCPSGAGLLVGLGFQCQQRMTLKITKVGGNNQCEDRYQIYLGHFSRRNNGRCIPVACQSWP